MSTSGDRWAALGAQEARAHPRQQQAAQHRPERARLELGAGAGGDRLGGRVGLLGGDSALLEREAGRVARGPDVDLAVHLSEWVGREEARARRAESPSQARAFEPRQRHGAVGADRAAGRDRQLAVGERERGRAGDELDAAVLEQLERSPSSPSAPNSSSGASSGVTMVTRTSGRARVDEPRPREQRELVERKRPAGAARNGEDEALDLARERVLEHLRQLGAPRPGRGSTARRAARRPEPRREPAASRSNGSSSPSAVQRDVPLRCRPP